MISDLKLKWRQLGPFIFFLPFLILYSGIVLLLSKDAIIGDESRYLMYAENLTKGFYSPPAPGIDLGNGPGYPLVIAPFIAVGMPLIIIKLLNSVFYYLSVVFLFKTLHLVISFRTSLICSLIWALYPTSFEQIAGVLPETLTAMMIPLICFFIFKAMLVDHKKVVRKYLVLAGLSIGFLVLIKPIFGHVILTMAVGVLFLFLYKRSNNFYKKSFIILLVAFLVNIPYLVYTYNLTGKVLYWSSFGGNNLYWMSTPFENEYGDWLNYPPNPNNKSRFPGSDSIIRLQHQADFDYVFRNEEVKNANIIDGIIVENLTKGVMQDDLLKELAVRNIKQHPTKFLQNIISNASRMVFNYPASYVLQKPTTIRRFPINGTIVVLALFCLIPTLINWRKVLFPIRFMLFFSIIYFGGSLFGSADPRMFTPIVPILLIWIVWVWRKSVSVRLNWTNTGE